MKSLFVLNISFMKESKNNNLEKLEKVCKDCKSCLLKDGRKNVVFAKGNVNAKIMIIGEAPGKEEDEQGAPFVGRAGKYLDKLIAKAGIDKKDVYIANVVKCRPPANRNPKVEEIEQCANYLRMQTAFVDPELIVTLGNFSTRFILKTEEGISNLHGQVFNLGKYKVLPVYHPAATMYDPKKKKDLEKDICKIKELI